MIVHRLVKITFPEIKKVPFKWEQLLDLMQSWRPTLHYQIIYWPPPTKEWLKCNTDGVSKGNPGLSANGFCIRDGDGDLVYVEANGIGVNTNMVAEAT